MTKTSRRIVGGVSAAIILTGGVFMAAMLFGKPVKLEKQIDLPFALDRSLKEVLYCASLAPSSHNTQMWKIEVAPEQRTMKILLDDSRVLRQVDPHAREAYLSAGTLLENMRRAFLAYGYTASIEIEEVENAEHLLATVAYTGGQETARYPQSVALMQKRRTDKRQFSDRKIPPETVKMLSQGGAVFFPAGSEAFSYLSEGTAAAMQIQSQNQAKRDELAAWLRFSDKETRVRRDGLPAEQLGMSGIKKTFYYLFMNRESAKSDSYAKQGVDMTKGQAQSAAGFFVITGGDSMGDLVRAGMCAESLWLDAAEKDLSIHPMSQMLEEEPFRSEITRTLGLDAPVQMILRAGYVNSYGENSGIRRPLSSFVTVRKG